MRRPRLAPVVLLTALAAVLPACDGSETPLTTATFGGLTYTAAGSGELSLRGGALVVSNTGDADDDFGVSLPVAATATGDLDVAVEPVDLGTAGRFGVQAFGTVGGVRTAIATAYAVASGDGTTHRIVADFATTLGITGVVFAYYLDGALVAESPTLPFTPGGLDFNKAFAMDGGGGGGDPRSTHTTRRGGVVEVGTDYEPGGNRPADGTGCAGIFVTVSFRDIPLCIDYVAARPIRAAGGTDVPPLTDITVEARAIDEFAITSGTLE